jgi:chromo domain-containing protein 1
MPDNMEIVDDDDDDNISITSTVWSEEKSEYEVETILTELKFPDGIKYLVKWDGYPVERSTWEPGESFTDPETLREWKTRKKAIERGDEDGFDLEGWENRVEALEDARDERKRKRRAKRIRLGLPVSDAEAKVDEESDSSSSSDPPFSGSRSERLRQDRQSSPGSSIQTSGGFESRTGSNGTASRRERPSGMSDTQS